jgi:hypothetical protein
MLPGDTLVSAVADELSFDQLTVDQPYVDAVVNYTRKTGVRPVNYTFDPPAGMLRNSGEVEPHVVRIRNARHARGLALDVSGFEMIRHRSSIADWRSFTDADRVKAIDYPEVEAALKHRTGADKVLIFDHTLRDSIAAPGRTALREPVRRVHDDQTLDSAPRRVARHLPREEAEWRLRQRFAIVNFWRPIGDCVRLAPLAVCDARTIDAADLIASDLVYPDWTGETYAVAYNPRHIWFWYPYQQPSEATLLKIYDSVADGPARLTAHTAFDDPASDPGAPPRRSIEIRAILFWE